jgi:hypothetical protein
VIGYRRFEGNYCFHLQEKNGQAIKQFFFDCFILEDEGIASPGEPLTQPHSVTSLKT